MDNFYHNFQSSMLEKQVRLFYSETSFFLTLTSQMARILWCEGLYWEEDSEDSWAIILGDPSVLLVCVKGECLYLIFCWLQMGFQSLGMCWVILRWTRSFNDISNCIWLSWGSPCILQGLAANPIFKLVIECSVLWVTSTGHGMWHSGPVSHWERHRGYSLPEPDSYSEASTEAGWCSGCCSFQTVLLRVREVGGAGRHPLRKGAGSECAVLRAG